VDEKWIPFFLTPATSRVLDSPAPQDVGVQDLDEAVS
jgi:hypothetical protein